MKIIQNLFSFLIALLLIIVTITLALYSFGILTIDLLPEIVRSTYNSWQYAIVYLVIFLMSIFIIYPYFSDSKLRSAKLLSSESGDISITITALANLVEERVKNKENFSDIKIKIEEAAAGLNIILSGKLTVPGNIAEISESIQRDLQTYIKETTGIQVEKIQINISAVEQANKLPENVE